MDRFLKLRSAGGYDLVSEIKGFVRPALTAVSYNMDLESEYFIFFDKKLRGSDEINIMATWLSGAMKRSQAIYGDAVIAEKLNKNGIRKAQLGSLSDKNIEELLLVIREDEALAAKVVSEMIQRKGVE